ncbi:protein neprosin-like [Setaria viridis]|uniref:protein neprosin-like n=1 Tax=Setaria viridis TaxID=4556 RepID=UPI003B39FD3F
MTKDANRAGTTRYSVATPSPIGDLCLEAVVVPFEFAHHGTETSPDGYYGFIATLDVYGFTLKLGQGTAGAVWVVGSGDGTQSSAKTIIIGWNVLPAEYGDSRAHFFTAWTDDGFIKTGCLNTKCPGFQPEKGAPIAPGDAIEHVSSPKGDKQNLNLRIVKDGASGDWLVHLGLNMDPELIGRFPRSLFTGSFAEKAAAIRFGGMVTAPAADPAPMGSGYLPAAGDAAASVSNIQLVGRDGRASPVTRDLPKLESKPDAYAVSPIENGKFFYGGPQRA